MEGLGGFALGGLSVVEEAVRIFFVIHMGVMGTSHVLQPKVWVDFFVRLREWGEPGVFVAGFLSLMFGSIVVAFHNVWQGVPILVTLLGWAHVAKGAIYFAFPAVGRKGLAQVNPERSAKFVMAGVLLLAVAGVVAFDLFIA